MKAKSLLAIFFAIASLSTQIQAKESIVETKEEKKPVVDIVKVSEAFGHLIAKNIESLGLNFDTSLIIRGIQDSLAGKPSPLSESECIQAITQIQEEAFQKQAKENLAKADEFLIKNASQIAVRELEKGKLQYKIEKEGHGEIVKEDYSPTIRYVGKFLDGTVFGASKDDEVISLKETISGFAKGIVGMKEGEKRTLYIHPDLAYGANGYLPPNSMLTFEIELIRANTPQKEESVANLDSEQSMDEIAKSENKEEAIR